MSAGSGGFEPIPFRIRIGVTGHRKGFDEGRILELVRQAIAEGGEIDKLFSEKDRKVVAEARRTGKPRVLYSVVTPLAEGADRVVARAVLEREGATIEVALPLAESDYFEDFPTEQSKAEFRELMSRCRNPVRLRRRGIADDAGPGDDAGDMRNAAYEAVGHWVVDHCDVLIAIWNSEPAAGRGGTAQIVDYARAHKRPVVIIWDSVTVDRGVGLSAASLAAIAEFNGAPITNEQRRVHAANLERECFADPAAGPIPDDRKQLVRENLFPTYVQASILAESRQRLFHWAGFFVYLFSALSVASVAVAVAMRDDHLAPLAYFFELILLAVAWLVVQRSRRSHAHEKWMENRFLAERIRSGIHLALCGVEPTPIELPPYMGHAHEPDDWMVRAFNETWGKLPPLSPCSPSLCPVAKEYASKVWIQGQIDFHKGKAEREGGHAESIFWIGQILFFITLGAAFVHVVFKDFVHGAPRVNMVLTLIALVFPAVLASLAGIRAHREFVRLEKRSQSMAHQLEVLARRLDTGGNTPPELRRMLLQVDEAMLRETQDWLSLMRYVEIEAG